MPVITRPLSLASRGRRMGMATPDSGPAVQGNSGVIIARIGVKRDLTSPFEGTAAGTVNLHVHTQLHPFPMHIAPWAPARSPDVKHPAWGPIMSQKWCFVCITILLLENWHGGCIMPPFVPPLM